jgi:ABC-type multidrug transport system fused ATPase/permease subunit
VIVLDKGHLVEQGAPATLLRRRDGRFARLLELQINPFDEPVGTAE